MVDQQLSPVSMAGSTLLCQTFSITIVHALVWQPCFAVIFRLKLALAPRIAHKEPKWTDSYMTNRALAVIAREATASSGHHGCTFATSCSCDVYQLCSAAALDVFYLQRYIHALPSSIAS